MGAYKRDFEAVQEMEADAIERISYRGLAPQKRTEVAFEFQLGGYMMFTRRVAGICMQCVELSTDEVCAMIDSLLEAAKSRPDESITEMRTSTAVLDRLFSAGKMAGDELQDREVTKKGATEDESLVDK